MVRSNSAIRSKVVACFESLLEMLPITKSQLLLKSLMEFSAGICEVVLSEKTLDCFRSYLASTSSEGVCGALQIAFEKFFDLTDKGERMDVLNKFLMQMLLFCKEEQVLQFYRKNARKMYEVVKSDVPLNEDAERGIVSKIGCYGLFGAMFSQVEEVILRVESQIEID